MLIRDKNQGIALIQVLLICAVISVLALYFSLLARQQVQVATIANDKSLAYMHLKTAESQILLSLFTRQQREQDAEQGLAGINTHGSPFAIGDHVQAQVQDLSGLISIAAPHRQRLINTLIELGASRREAELFVGRLIDWQDDDNLPRANGQEQYGDARGPRNRRISTLDELDLIAAEPYPWLKPLKSLLTTQWTPYFNPRLAPAPILRAHLGQDADIVLESRETNVLTSREYQYLTGEVGQDGLIFVGSDLFRITLQAKVGQAFLTKQLTVELDPYAEAPVAVLNHINEKW